MGSRRIWGGVFFLFFFTTSLQAQNCSVNAGIPKTICAENTLELEGSVSGSYDASTLTWSVVSEPATASTVLPAPQSVVSETDELTVGGSYTFQLSAQCTDGNWTSQNITHTIDAVPSQPTASWTYQTCVPEGTPISITGSAIPAGATAQWIWRSGTPGSIANAGSASTTFTPNFTDGFCLESSVNTLLEYEITNSAGCSDSRYLFMSFAPSFGAPEIEGGDGLVCSSCVDLLGTCPGPGGSGVWSFNSKPAGAPDPTFGDVNNRETTLCGLQEGDYEIEWTITGGCDAGSVTKTISVAAGGGVTTANAGADRSFCDLPSTIMLNGSAPSMDEIGTWTQLAGPVVTISDPTDYNTTVTGLEDGNRYRFAWQIDAPSTCSSADDVWIMSRPELREDESDNGLAGCGGTWLQSTLFEWDSIMGSSENLYDTVTITFETVRFSTEVDPNARIRPYIYINNPGSYLYATNSTVDGYSYTWTIPNLNQYAANPGGTHFMRLSSRFYEAGLYTFRVTVENSCFTEVREMDLSVNLTEGFSGVNAGTDQVLACGNTSTALAGNAMVSGGYYRGKWTVVEKPAGSPGVTFAPGRRSQTPTISGLAPGKYVFTISLETGVSDIDPYFDDDCPAQYDEVEIYVSSGIPDKPDLGPDQTICHVNSYGLSAPISSTGAPVGWTQISGPNTLTFSPSASAHDVAVSGLLASSTYRFVWTDTNGCGVNSDTLDLIVNSTTGPSDASISTTDICSNTSSVISLSATAPATGTGTWSVLSGPGSLSFSPSATSSSVTASSLTYGGYYDIVYTVAVSGCPNTSVDTITVYRGSSTITYPDYEDSFLSDCNLALLPYSNSYAPTNTPTSGMNYSWEIISTPDGVDFPTITDADSIVPTITFYATGQYRVQYTADRGACGTYSYDYPINLSMGGDIALAGSDTTLCSGTSLTLNGNNPSSGTGLWTIDQVLDGNPVVTIADETLYNSTATITGTGTVRLAWSTFGDDFMCGAAARDYVEISRVTAAAAGANQDHCGANAVQLDAETVYGANGSWSLLSGPNTPTIADSGDPKTVVTDLVAGTYTFRWTVSPISGSGCTTTDDVVIDITAQSGIFAGWDLTSLCFGATETIDLNAYTPPAGYTGTWTLEQRPGAAGSIDDINDPTTIYEYAQDSGLYVFKWEITDGGVCSREDYVNFNVNSATCGTVLPLDLVHFEVRKGAENFTALLSWITESEIDFSHFEIEHSTNAVEWNYLGEEMPRRETGGAKDYNFLHQNAPLGINYYRLKMMDLDGSYEYSEIRVLNFAPEAVVFYPNPSNGAIKARNLEERSNLQVHDQLGREFSIKQTQSGVFEINAPAGAYIISYMDALGQPQYQRMVIAK